ncbi:MAG TPA: VanZ family protein, partial [Burkholderiales bacterium]|nr:VanZ family protein [Burkholderiales bacterium]
MSQPITDLARHVRKERAPLGVYLAGAYTLLIIHASLNPFTGWRSAPDGMLAFLGTWPRYVTAFDVAVNIAGYVPFGLLLGLALARRLRQPELMLVVAALGTALSFSMEALQSLLPGRIASLVDLLANGAGAALGAAAAPWLRHPRFKARAFALRNAMFLQGRTVDWGLALLGLWLFAQTNPALPL